MIQRCKISNYIERLTHTVCFIKNKNQEIEADFQFKKKIYHIEYKTIRPNKSWYSFHWDLFKKFVVIVTFNLWTPQISIFYHDFSKVVFPKIQPKVKISDFHLNFQTFVPLLFPISIMLNLYNVPDFSGNTATATFCRLRVYKNNIAVTKGLQQKKKVLRDNFHRS